MSKKTIIVILVLIFVLYKFFDSNYLVVQKHEKFANEIAELLSPKYFSNKLTGKLYSVREIIQPTDSIFKVLKQKGIINDQSYFSYSTEGCITLVSRKSKKILGGFSDIMITRNENGEQFMCGVNAIYSLNNDENAESLNIQCHNLAGHMTLAFISTLF
ncbi:hypothetical protein [Sediminibacterium sp.]|uniref:hypothetical protein n=1 Tax=Sediminibacterium sp. TaxID=1917865 RepID=UPI0027377802|nr:hypothetical protein [Sediminibacterium sp.]MDP3568446.1 hypothetical protein [Sediminibacterium sp.]